MILMLNKPAGWTSFDVVRKIRNVTREKKVGHGGTLDPFATGLLILGTGRDTKRLSAITQSRKTYEARLLLGKATDTMDSEGKIVETADVPPLTTDSITATLKAFHGIQKQVPPMYSAKKIDGKRLYKLARQNIEVDRPAVEIEVHKMELMAWNDPVLDFRVTSSKGTYIRVLGADLARALGSVGHLVELKRTAIGDYQLGDALTIEKFIQQWKSTAT